MIKNYVDNIRTIIFYHHITLFDCRQIMINKHIFIIINTFILSPRDIYLRFFEEHRFLVLTFVDINSTLLLHLKFLKNNKYGLRKITEDK